MGNTIFLLVLFHGAQMAYDGDPAPVAITSYETLIECQAALRPLIGAGTTSWYNCIEEREGTEWPNRPGWINGPSAGAWQSMLDTNEFNDKARRGLWPYSQWHLYYHQMARDY
jgi:hypothetical protein